MKTIIIFILLSFIMISCSASKSDNSSLNELKYPKNLKIIKRTDWGWIPIKEKFKTHSIKYITIHHGGVEFGVEEDPVDHVKNLQTWSRSEKNWVDIPYHFMIDLEGKIYETRPINIPGDTNTEYDPTNHALIEVMGNYEIQEPNDQQLKSMIDLIKFVAEKFNVDYQDVKTHRDYSKMTVCPGKNIYKYFENDYIASQLRK